MFRRTVLLVTAVVALSACTPGQYLRYVSAVMSGHKVEADAAVEAYKQVKAEVTAGTHCQEWYDTAVDAGWQPSDWDELSIIMWTESFCNPLADSPISSARGLTQILQSWLGACGLTYAQLHDGFENLRCAALIYYHGGGRSNWSHFNSAF